MKSIVSYPERGIGGNSKWRGNCSPRLIEDLIDQFNWKSLSDYMMGSGTSRDAAYKKGIIENYHGYDLHSGFDLMNDEIKERNEAVFWHPPYFDIIKYSDNMYSANDVIQKYGYDPRKTDLSRISNWNEFIKCLNYCTIKQFCSLEKGGRLAILMGDVKKSGKLYSMLCNICKPGIIESIVIKEQHNYQSANKTYNGNFIPICHEYLLILKKPVGTSFEIQYSKSIACDQRDLNQCTWRDTVASVLEMLNGQGSLNEIYGLMENHKKTSNNPYWKEKIRQTLQTYNIFKKVDRGVWALV